MVLFYPLSWSLTTMVSSHLHAFWDGNCYTAWVLPPNVNCCLVTFGCWTFLTMTNPHMDAMGGSVPPLALKCAVRANCPPPRPLQPPMQVVKSLWQAVYLPHPLPCPSPPQG